MGALIDVMLSIFLSGAITLLIMQTNFDMIERRNLNTIYLITQEAGLTLKEIIKHDLKSAGYGIRDSSNVFTLADSNQIKFRTDVGFDSTINVVHYYMGDIASAGFTSNPRDKLLFKRVDSDPPETLNFGLVDLVFTYFDKGGQPTSVLADIRQVGYSFYVENHTGYDNNYPGTFMIGKVSPRNIGLK